MSRWADLEQEAPEIARAGRDLFYQFGVGLGFLATVRKDGGPRLHPICPIVVDGGLYAFILPSPKLDDLRRDGRYALHSFPPEHNDDEFYLTGRAVELEDPDIRRAVNDAYHHDAGAEEVLFELHLDRCLLARYESRGVFPPDYVRWISPGLR